eukprot:COSAG02_NODE_1151_length_14205_cov_1183.813342_5_plen_106_part_00
MDFGLVALASLGLAACGQDALLSILDLNKQAGGLALLAGLKIVTCSAAVCDDSAGGLDGLTLLAAPAVGETFIVLWSRRARSRPLQSRRLHSWPQYPNGQDTDPD